MTIAFHPNFDADAAAVQTLADEGMIIIARRATSSHHITSLVAAVEHVDIAYMIANKLGLSLHAHDHRFLVIFPNGQAVSDETFWFEDEETFFNISQLD